MSITYGIDVNINAAYSQQNIHFILEKGAKLGFRYYGCFWEKNENFVILDIKNTVKEIMKQSSEPFKNSEPRVYVKLEDTYFFFCILNKKDSMEVSLGGFASPWKKEFWNSPYGDTLMIDFARYIRLLLKLCEDFTILKLETSAD